MQSHAKCTRDFEYSRKTWIAVFAERVIESLRAESGIASDLRHAFRADNFSKCTDNARRIVGRFDKPGVEIRGYFFWRA